MTDEERNQRPLVTISITTRYPEKWELIDHEDDSRWVIRDGYWKAGPWEMKIFDPTSPTGWPREWTPGLIAEMEDGARQEVPCTFCRQPTRLVRAYSAGVSVRECVNPECPALMPPEGLTERIAETIARVAGGIQGDPSPYAKGYVPMPARPPEES